MAMSSWGGGVRSVDFLTAYSSLTVPVSSSVPIVCSPRLSFNFPLSQCIGHRGSDVFPYGILSEVMTPQFTFWGKTGPNTINNRDLVHLFDPRVNALSYIFDNFQWEHCTESGWDFNDLFADSALKEQW